VAPSEPTLHRTLRIPHNLLPAIALAALAWTGAAAHEPTAVPIAELTRRIAERPDSVELYLARGELRRVDGDFAGAREDHERVERLAPRHPALALQRAALALDAREPAVARRLLDATLVERPSDAQALRLRARAHRALGDAPAAIADLGRTIALVARPHPDLFLERARLQVEEGDHAGARAGLDQARTRLGAVASLELYAIELDLADGRPAAARERLEGLGARLPDPAPLAGVAARIAAAGGGVADPIAAASGPPALEVAARAASPAAGSGASGVVTALPRNSVWKYDATGTDLGLAWRQTGYDDSAWPSGPGALGYGEPWIATTVPYGPDPANKYTTTYFRTTFQVTDPVANILSLTMTADYDDGFVVYVNGIEGARRAMPAGSISYPVAASGHEGGAYESIDLSAVRGWLVPGTNVLAVEVHQVSPGSADLVWDADLTYSDIPHLTRGPYLQVGTANAVTVRWRTSGAVDSRVRYGTSPDDLSQTASGVGVTTEHEVRLTGLSPATRYYYSIGTASVVLAGDSTFHFRTAPAAGSSPPVRAWVIGDSGLPTQAAFDVRDAYSAWTGARGTDLWLMLGDNAYPAGTDAEYQIGVFDQYPLMLRQSVLWPTRGNHDLLYAGAGNDYYDIFTMPAAAEAGGVASGTEAYYSFDWANIHVICLDSQGSARTPGSAMLTWLAADLAANARPWIVAFWHHPPYSKGSHDSDTESQLKDMRQYALPILEAGGVDLVLTGHSHSYERSFLLDGHYGLSGTLTPGMVKDGGDGRVGGDGAYVKPAGTAAPNAGTVHAVAGSACQVSGGPLNHPVMVTSLNLWGSMVLDVHRTTLHARFLDREGAVLDSFTIVKTGVADAGDRPGAARGIRLGPGLPNPFAFDLRMSYALETAGHVRLSVHDASGRRVATVEEGWRGAGAHEARWDGRDAQGREMPNGVYLAVLEAQGERVSRKIAHVR
jgi:Tfp pilus assembly protein PilF